MDSCFRRNDRTLDSQVIFKIFKNSLCFHLLNPSPLFFQKASGPEGKKVKTQKLICPAEEEEAETNVGVPAGRIVP